MMRLSRRALRPLSLGGVAILIALAVSWAVAFAQYPQPVGSVTASASDAAPAAGATVTVSCVVLDNQGQPVANETVTFTITSQPGTDASLGAPSITAKTNAQGVATAALSVGTKAGAIVVGVSARGIQSQVTVNAQTPAATVPPGAEPGAAPPTGAGGGDEGQVPVAVWSIAIGAAAGLALVSLFLWRTAARRPKNS